MNKRDMVAKMRRAAESMLVVTPELSDHIMAGAAALEREAEAEEKARPNVTLEEQAEFIASRAVAGPCSCGRPNDPCEDSKRRFAAAAETLRRLREDGGKMLAHHQGGHSDIGRFLRSLGVEPKA